MNIQQILTNEDFLKKLSLDCSQEMQELLKKALEFDEAAKKVGIPYFLSINNSKLNSNVNMFNFDTVLDIDKKRETIYLFFQAIKTSFEMFGGNKYEIILKRKSQDNQEFSITE
jgi:hypothetical protein